MFDQLKISYDEMKFLHKFRLFYKKKDKFSYHWIDNEGVYIWEIKGRVINFNGGTTIKSTLDIIESLKKKGILRSVSSSKYLGLTEYGKEVAEYCHLYFSL